MKKNILLISPESDNEALWIFIDINTRFKKKYDLVGITGYKTHLSRCRELAKIFRQHKIPVAIGGPGVSGTPDAYRGDFNILFIGEAERTWPRFLQEWQSGISSSEYRQIEKIDLAESPIPKWDSMGTDILKYAMGSVQTSRGCPFDCEFCDVIYLFGRRPRHKPIRTVLEEVRTLERLGLKSIFFSDDEFIGDRRHAKDLLRALIPLNNSLTRPLTFSTQLTINVSKDEELLELLADANFHMLFVGIETPNKKSLKETHKFHNLRRDLVADVQKILAHGMAVRAGMIVGFDNDGPDIFDLQHDFIQEACLPSLAINMLKAPLGTKLWARLHQEGRVVSLAKVKDQLNHPRSYTNVIPKRMNRVDLMKGYRSLLERVYSWENFRDRMIGFVSLVNRSPRAPKTLVRSETVIESGSAVDVELKGIQAVDEIIKYTEEKAPFLMQRVKALIVQHARYLDSIQKLLPQLDRQIELETSGKLPLEIDNRPITVPPAFRQAFKTIFPDLYRYVHLNLIDKSNVPEALVEIVVDFLVR
ncbi:MAG: B12-binding domain-containing radical SAM protein, partial [Planctomycetota bacterium]